MGTPWMLPEDDNLHGAVVNIDLLSETHLGLHHDLGSRGSSYIPRMDVEGGSLCARRQKATFKQWVRNTLSLCHHSLGRYSSIQQDSLYSRCQLPYNMRHHLRQLWNLTALGASSLPSTYFGQICFRRAEPTQWVTSSGSSNWPSIYQACAQKGMGLTLGNSFHFCIKKP